MRRFLVVLFILGATLVRDASAQSYATDRHVWQVGGTARFTSYHVIDGGSSRTFSINPRLGLFVVPGLAVGANLFLGHSSNDNTSATQYGIGPGLTYYFRHRSATINPYINANTLFIHSSFDGGSANDFNWLVSAGLAIFLARNVAITGELFYTHAHTEAEFNGQTGSGSSEEYGSQFGVSVFVW